mmetsp:Transcript_72437/g.172657  ORF Transcript_72437/g.172657 Transcript_72437/m.172657 type:complete len:212 (+) Transcript_72437:147-782(+)
MASEMVFRMGLDSSNCAINASSVLDAIEAASALPAASASALACEALDNSIEMNNVRKLRIPKPPQPGLMMSEWVLSVSERTEHKRWMNSKKGASSPPLRCKTLEVKICISTSSPCTSTRMWLRTIFMYISSVKESPRSACKLLYLARKTCCATSSGVSAGKASITCCRDASNLTLLLASTILLDTRLAKTSSAVLMSMPASLLRRSAVKYP